MFDALIAASARLEDPAYRAQQDAVTATAAKAAKPFKSKSCLRCSGKGSLSCFGHVSRGICFACNGTGNKHNA
jgi:hypothetical protein